MKKALLLVAASLMVGGNAIARESVHMAAAAQKTVSAQPSATVQVRNLPAVTDSKVLPAGKFVQTVKDADGRVYKRLVDGSAASMPVSSLRSKAKAARVEAVESLSEDFEEFDFTPGWQPEGWAIDSKTAVDPDDEEAEVHNWAVAYAGNYYADGYDGYFAEFMDLVQTNEVDEWLLTPYVTIMEGYELNMLCWYDLLFAVDLNYLDFEILDFTEWHPSQNLIIWAREEGGEWEEVHNFFNDADGKSYMDLLDLYTGNFEKMIFSLDKWAGKTIQIGFQNVGIDGNACAIDMVKIGLPELKTTYEFPASSLFYGISHELRGLSLGVPVLPVYAPITWTNTTEDPEGVDVEYNWMYYDSNSEMQITGGRDLVATYFTDYSSEFTTRNNLYYTPTLFSSAPGYSAGMFSAFDYFQTGGRGEWDNDGTLINLGLMPFDPSSEGYSNATATLDGEKVAVFGYSENVGAFWKKALGADEDASVESVCDIVYVPQQPVVFSNLWTHAYYKELNPDVTMTVEIIALNPDGTLGDVIASATSNTSDAIVGSLPSYGAFVFDFGRPIVMAQIEMGEMVVLRWSGFKGIAEFFCPMQSYYGSYNGVSKVFVEVSYKLDGKDCSSLLNIQGLTGSAQAFGFCFDGVFPWLVSYAMEVYAPEDEPVEIRLDSYYDGEELTVTTDNENVTASVSGRYDDCILTINAPAGNGEVTVKVTGPGVETSVLVKTADSGISAVGTDNGSTVSAIYDLQGRRVTDNTVPGLYIRRLSNGNVEKVVIK